MTAVFIGSTFIFAMLREFEMCIASAFSWSLMWAMIQNERQQDVKA